MADRNSDEDAPTISFRMQGKMHALSLSKFALHMGIYEPDELPGCIGSWIPRMNLDRAQLWHTLTGLQLYDATTYKASNILDRRIWILHRIIATTFNGRLESAGNVTHGDLAILNAIINNQYLCPARVLAMEFSKMSGKLANQTIVGGAFIS